MNEASISALLQFLYTDSWEGPGEDDGLAFRVFALADRYQLMKLVDIAEGHLHRLLRPDRVLRFLARMTRPCSSSLEQACWDLFDEEFATIMEEGEGDLNIIVKEDPELAKKMIVRAGLCSRGVKRRRMDCEVGWWKPLYWDKNDTELCSDM